MNSTRLTVLAAALASLLLGGTATAEEPAQYRCVSFAVDQRVPTKGGEWVRGNALGAKDELGTALPPGWTPVGGGEAAVVACKAG